MQLDYDDFEEIISDSIEELSQELEMSPLGATVNLLLHVFEDLSFRDPHALYELLQKYNELLKAEIDPDQWTTAVLHAMEQWQMTEDVRRGKIPLN